MRRLLSVIVSLTWALWFGGLISLFIVVTALFHTFAGARSLAGTGAAGIFHAFERYQLALAAAVLLATFGWRLLPVGRPTAPRLKTAFFALLALAAIAASCSTLFITPRIDALHERGITSGAEFGRLHGTSMLLYAVESLLLLFAGLLLPSTIARDTPAARVHASADESKTLREPVGFPPPTTP